MTGVVVAYEPVWAIGAAAYADSNPTVEILQRLSWVGWVRGTRSGKRH